MNLLKEAGSALGVVAPLLATAIGGPLAGTAANFVCQALGLQGGASDADVSAAIATATPDQLLALKKAEADFQEAMQQLQIDASALTYADTADARDRERSVMDWTPRILGYAVVGGFMTMAACVLTGKANTDSVIAGTIIGYMSAKAELVLGYYFGSSAGSAIKSEQLANSVPASLLKVASIPLSFLPGKRP